MRNVFVRKCSLMLQQRSLLGTVINGLLVLFYDILTLVDYSMSDSVYIPPYI